MAQDEIDTDRPDQTESAYTVPKNWLQLEMGFSCQKNASDNYEYFSPTLLSKYGVTRKIELRIITTIVTNSSVLLQGKTNKTGLDPVEIGAKISFWEQKKWIPKTSFIFHFAIPGLASKANNINLVAPNFRFTLQNAISKNFAIGYNLGAEWNGEDGTPTFVYTLSPGINFAKKWYGYVEAFGSINKYEVPQHNLDGGLAYYFSPNIKADISAGFGISRAAPDWYIALGFSVRWKARGN